MTLCVFCVWMSGTTTMIRWAHCVARARSGPSCPPPSPLWTAPRPPGNTPLPSIAFALVLHTQLYIFILFYIYLRTKAERKFYELQSYQKPFFFCLASILFFCRHARRALFTLPCPPNFFHHCSLFFRQFSFCFSAASKT